MRPAAFEQGVAMQEWPNAVTGPPPNSENAGQKPLVHCVWVHNGVRVLKGLILAHAVCVA